MLKPARQTAFVPMQVIKRREILQAVQIQVQELLYQRFCGRLQDLGTCSRDLHVTSDFTNLSP
jgi:hypothetical protein